MCNFPLHADQPAVNALIHNLINAGAYFIIIVMNQDLHKPEHSWVCPRPSSAAAGLTDKFLLSLSCHLHWSLCSSGLPILSYLEYFDEPPNQSQSYPSHCQKNYWNKKKVHHRFIPASPRLPCRSIWIGAPCQCIVCVHCVSIRSVRVSVRPADPGLSGVGDHDGHLAARVCVRAWAASVFRTTELTTLTRAAWTTWRELSHHLPLVIMWKYDKKVTITVSLGDNFFTPSWLLFLPPSSSSSPSQFSSLGLSELSWFTRSTPSPLVTSLFSWGGFGLKEDTSLNKVKTTVFVKKKLFFTSEDFPNPEPSRTGRWTLRWCQQWTWWRARGGRQRSWCPRWTVS